MKRDGFLNVTKAGRPPRRRRRPVKRPPRGSVLVFAVVLLVLLVMIGAAFLVAAQQEFKATRNALSGLQAELAAEAGLEHALGVLRNAVRTSQTLSPDGAFYRSADALPAAPGFTDFVNPLDDPDVTTFADSPTRFNAFRTFEEYPAGYDGDEVYAALYWNENRDWCGAALPAWPQLAANRRAGETLWDYVFTNTPLTTGATWPNGQRFQAVDGDNDYPEHFGWARRFLVYAGCNGFDTADDDDPNGTPPTGFYKFFPGDRDTVLSELPKVSRVRGEYFIWIDDLDAKLYAVPKALGVQADGTLGDDFSFDEVLAYDPDSETAVLRGILDRLNRCGDDYLSSADWGDDGTDYTGLSLTDAADDADSNDLKFLREHAAAKPYSSQAEMLRFLIERSTDQATAGPLDRAGYAVASPDPDELWKHLYARAGLERYFTPYDNGKAPDLNTAPALNVNTAPLEVLAAALSQVPLVEGYAPDPGDPTYDDNLAKALALAKRIVAKRPFLCRLDFEDFLAAQIGDEWIDDLPGEITGDPEDSMVSLIYYAMDKRAEKADGSPELSLAEYLEIPNLPDDNPLYQGVNTRDWQKKRFKYFNAGLTDIAPGEYGDARLTLRAFNNLLNSVSSGDEMSSDDVQEEAPGTAGLPPDTMVISVGDNGELETAPAGDDVLIQYIRAANVGDDPLSLPGLAGDDVYDAGTKTIRPGPDRTLQTPKVGTDIYLDVQIEAGPNGIADTAVGVRPSYYSFWNDQEYIDGAPGEPDDKYMKFSYDDPDYPVIGELHTWRAKPLATGQNARYPGYYQFFADPGGIDYPLAAFGADLSDPLDPDESYEYAAADPTKNHGDAAWSPRFCFRSRFFKIYVLAHGLEGGPGSDAEPGKLNFRGTRRLEAVYDALLDRIVWRRRQVTEKRDLSGFDPPNY